MFFCSSHVHTDYVLNIHSIHFCAFLCVFKSIPMVLIDRFRTSNEFVTVFSCSCIYTQVLSIDESQRKKKTFSICGCVSAIAHFPSNFMLIQRFSLWNSDFRWPCQMILLYSWFHHLSRARSHHLHFDFKQQISPISCLIGIEWEYMRAKTISTIEQIMYQFVLNESHSKMHQQRRFFFVQFYPYALDDLL